MNDQATAGCFGMVFLLLIILLVNPAMYGGAAQMIFGIDNMSYGQKFVGGLSGLGPSAYIVAWTLKPYMPTPFVTLAPQ